MLYLASQSPRRKQILRKLNIPFQTVTSNYAEVHHGKVTGRALALMHAEGKARRAKLPKGASAWVLGADTVVYAQKKILGKPQNRKEAAAMLRILSGKTHRVYTAIALWHPQTRIMIKQCAVTRVTMKKLTEAQMQSYIERTHPYDKAGGYAIQDKPAIVKSIRGSHSNVIGFPIELFRRILRQKKLLRTLKAR